MNAIEAFEEFQVRVVRWFVRCFRPELVQDKRRAMYAFGEEAAELLQTELTEDEAIAIVRHVFARPPGKTAQEIAGALLTLIMVGSAYDINPLAVASVELARVEQPETIAKIRTKQRGKLTYAVYEQRKCEQARFHRRVISFCWGAVGVTLIALIVFASWTWHSTH